MSAVENLSVRFGRTLVLDNVTFAVPSGGRCGIVGESGSAKSTILRTVMRLNRDWSGRIEVDRLDPGRASRKGWARHVQMVFQDPYGSLHPRYTVGQQIAEPLRINRIADPDGRTGELLELIGLGRRYAASFPHELSGGQRQRVAIARALALSPKVLLLDEPTSALDVSIQAEILNLLNRLRRDLGLTYVIVSHDLAVISYMCERLMVMQAGQVVESLSREDLRARRITNSYTSALLAPERVSISDLE